MRESKNSALAAVLLLAIAACGQKKLSSWELNNAVISPDPIELTPGSAYKLQVMVPNPDGPLSPLNAQVAWLLEAPVQGVSIDPQTGQIKVAEGVAHGTTAAVVARVENGRRVLKAALVVFSRETNPFVGAWRVESLIACGDGHEMKPDPALHAPLAREHLSFRARGEFWIGLEMNIAAHTTLAGTYEYDLKAGTITLKPKWPPGKTGVLWACQLSEEGRKLAVRTAKPEDPAGQVCGYVFKLQ